MSGWRVDSKINDWTLRFNSVINNWTSFFTLNQFFILFFSCRFRRTWLPKLAEMWLSKNSTVEATEPRRCHVMWKEPTTEDNFVIFTGKFTFWYDFRPAENASLALTTDSRFWNYQCMLLAKTPGLRPHRSHWPRCCPEPPYVCLPSFGRRDA